MKTKAAVLRNIGGPLIIEELEIPVLKQGQVLVKILYSGLCHSNINEIKGRKGAEFIPHLTGHEASAVVMEVGRGVTKVQRDDFVVCSWIKGRGLEALQVRYQSCSGIVNAGACATFCDYAVMSENHLAPVSKKVEPTVAALLGCAVLTGMGIVDALPNTAGKKLIVFGIGGIGASALMRAVALRANCIAVDIMEWKLQWAAKELRVDSVINASYQDLKELKGFDFAIECSGNKTAMETAFNCLANDGLAVIAGNLAPGETISIDPFDLIKGKKIYGNWGGGSFLDIDVAKYAHYHLQGRIRLEKLITAEYPLEQINQGLKDLEEGKLIRGVVKCQQ